MGPGFSNGQQNPECLKLITINPAGIFTLHALSLRQSRRRFVAVTVTRDNLGKGSW